VAWFLGPRGFCPKVDHGRKKALDIHLFIWKTMDVLILPLSLVLQSMNRVFQMSKNYQMLAQREKTQVLLLTTRLRN
jgi:hypothetical protein